MSGYIPFDKAEIEQAARTDLADFLRQRGETLKRSGSEWQWGTGSNKVTIRQNKWFHQYERVGGNAIAFVRRWYNLDFPQAVSFLLKEQGAPIPEAELQPKKKKPFVLPPANGDMRRVYAYLLQQRLIHREIISFFAHKGMLYEDAEFHNAVFVGFDEKGIARHAHKRGAHVGSGYKGNVTSSQPEYSFHWIGESDTMFVFEAPIDLLSYLTLHPSRWQEHSYVALCCAGLQAAVYQAKQNAHIREVAVCTDYDEAGLEAYYRIKEELSGLDRVTVRREQPRYKDWNEDIRAQHGIAPIPGKEHPRAAYLQELCGRLLAEGLPPCPAYPLEAMGDCIAKLKHMDEENQDAIQEQAWELSRLALSFCQKRGQQLAADASAGQLRARIMARYLPHRDHCGVHNRIHEMEEQWTKLRDAYGADRLYTHTELEQEAEQLLILALAGLRMYAFMELRPPQLSLSPTL